MCELGSSDFHNPEVSSSSTALLKSGSSVFTNPEVPDLAGSEFYPLLWSEMRLFILLLATSQSFHKHTAHAGDRRGSREEAYCLKCECGA
jgi:hypothetical protein